MIRVGTAGWSYPDWEGVVYPKGAAASRDALALLVRMFDTLEINVSFYRPPSSRMSQSWATRVATRPTFRFTAKLWQGFTHERGEEHAAEERLFKEGMKPLVEAGRLGALLAQFPHSFKDSPDNREYVDKLISRFAAYPLVVELRHVSWMEGDLLSALDGRGVGFCNVDQPVFSSSARPSTVMTGQVGYVRLHGRNKADWFRKDAGRDARYDYLYSQEEIRGWADRIRLMQGKSKGGADVFIIANNHYRGQAPANALELMNLLSGEMIEIPETLTKAFPRLAPIAAKPQRHGMLPL